MTQHHADQTTQAERTRRRPEAVVQAPEQGVGHNWQTLQRALGNDGTRRAIEREEIRTEQQRAEREGITPVSGDTQQRIEALAGRATAIEMPEAVLHFGPEVDQVAHGLSARAFTQGRDVFVGSGGRDKATIAHELTHVSRGQTGPGTVQRAPEEPEEIEMPAEYVGRDAQVPTGTADATAPADSGVGAPTADAQPAFSMYQPSPPAPVEVPSMLTVPAQDPITGGEASPLVSVDESTGPQVAQTATPPPTANSPDTGGATAMTTVEEKKEPEAQPPTSDATGTNQAEAIDSQVKETEEEEDEDDLQVSMTLPAPGEEPKYVKRKKNFQTLDEFSMGPKGPPLDPKVEAMIEGTYEPTYQEKIEKQFDQKMYDEEQLRKQRAAMVGQVPGPRPVKDSLGFTNEEDPGDLPFADSLVSGDFGRDTAYQSSVTSQPSTGGEEAPVQSTFPTLKSEEPKKAEEPKPLDPFIPQKFNIDITIDNVKKQYEGLTAEEAITQLKVEWNWCWSLVEIYQKWHEELKENRDDHPIVGFICDRVFGNGDPPSMAIWNDSQNRLNTVGRVLKKTLDQLKIEFQDNEKKREERMKRDDEERIAQGQTSLMKFMGPNAFGSKEQWEDYVTEHIGTATNLLQGVAASINARREAVFYYKEGSIKGGETAVKILTVTKKAGAFAASMLPIGRGLGLVKGALAAGGTSAAYNAGQGFAQQSGEMIFSDRTEFDFAQIGRDALKEGVGGFVGALAGGALGKAFGNALRRRLARKLGKEFNEVVLGKVQDFIFVQWGPNVLTSPLTTSTRMVLERALGERKTLSLEDIMDQIVSNLPEDALMGAAGSYVGGKVSPTPLHTSDGPAPDFGYTTTAPQRNIYAGGQPSPGVTKPAGDGAGAPVADVAPTPRPAPETPVAETPQTVPAETAPPVDTTAPPRAVTPTSNQPTRRQRAQPPPVPQAARRRRRDTQVDDVHTRPTREVPTVNNAPTRRRRAVTPDDAGVGDRTQETPIQDRPTERLPVQEPPGQRRDDGEMGPTYGPVEPWLHQMPDMTVMQAGNARDPVAATQMYEKSVQDNRGVEAALYHNPVTGEFIIVQGNEGTAAVAPNEGPVVGREQRWKEILDSPDVGRWELQRHSHPSEPGGNVAPVNQLPSGAGGDLQVMAAESIANGGEARSSVVDYQTPQGKRQTEFGFDPSLDQPFWIRLPDGGPPLSFRTIEQYQQYLETTYPGQVARREIPEWMSGNRPVQHARQAAYQANRPTQPQTVQGPDGTTRRMPTQGPDGTTQRQAAQGPEGTTERMPAQGPDGTTQRMPAQGPDGTTQRMPAQGPEGTTERMPEQGGSGRPMPRGPVEIVPVETASDARILMDGWPADRPLRLLANGEAKAAWNRDYRQPGDPPPAWMDPQAGLVVDTDQVPRPSSRDTYHVPAEDPYVMFNVHSPQEALSIYHQNEAANVINPANSARSFLLDHATFVQVFERGRGYSPQPPAAFVDQNGRLYIDISRVEITSLADGGAGGAPSYGGNSRTGTQAMAGQQPVGGPPPMPQDAMRATQEMGPQAPIGEAPALPRNARRTVDDEVTVIDEDGDFADTSVMAPQGPRPDAGAPGTPRSRDDRKTAPMGKVDPAAIAQRRIQGAEYISQENIRFFHATNRAIVRLNERLRSQGIPWSSDGGALWITTDAGSAFFGSNQVSVSRTRQIYDRYNIPWDGEAARLAGEPVYFEVDVSKLPSSRDAGDVVADFADGGNGRGRLTTDYTIKDLTGSPFEAMREISGPGAGAPKAAGGKPGGGEPVSGPPRERGNEADHIQESVVGGREAEGDGGSGRGAPGQRTEGGPNSRLQPPLPRETVDIDLVVRLNQEVGELAQGRGIAEGLDAAPAWERSQAEVELALRILENPNAGWEATNQALEVIVERAVSDFRAYRGTEQANRGVGRELSAANLRLICGEGRDVSADSIASFTIGSRSPVIVHRMQAANLGIHEAQHGFNVVVLANGKGFIVDPTFAQFADRSKAGFRAGGMLSHRRGLEIARNLLRDGFMPLTPANARAYAQGLGARPGEVDAAATRIMAGDPALLTEVVVDGEVHRITPNPAEAENNIYGPIEDEAGVSGSVAAIEGMLNSDRLAPNDPARLVLASLRDRLIMISARQPQLEADVGDIEALAWEPSPGPEDSGPGGEAPQAQAGPSGSEADHVTPFLMGGRTVGGQQGPDQGGPDEGGPPPHGEDNAFADEPTLVDVTPIDASSGAGFGRWGPPTREVQRQINDPQEAVRLYLEQVRVGNRNARAIRNQRVLDSTWRYTYRQYTNPPLAWLDTNGNITIDGLRVDIPGAVERGEV